MIIGDTIRGKPDNVVDVIEYKNAFFGEYMMDGAVTRTQARVPL
jgi:hypothetical protein